MNLLLIVALILALILAIRHGLRWADEQSLLALGRDIRAIVPDWDQ